MTKRKPDRREQKRIDKHNCEEEARRAKVILEISHGKSLRAAGAAVGRSHEYARYWRDKGMTAAGVRVADGRRRTKYVLKKGWKDLIKVRKPGPPKGRTVKRHLCKEEVVGLKKKYPKTGCAKLVVIGGLDISGPTACGILKEAGMIKPGKANRAPKRFRAKAPNDMWQIDYADLGHGQHMLSVLDDCSGKILSKNVRETTLTDDVLVILVCCFIEYGIPKVILSDHGTQWYATRGGDARFDRFCDDWGIEHKMGRINHPQTQGKVERWHRSLKEEAGIKDIADPAEKRKAAADYVDFFNAVRPHWGIGMRTPDSVYFAMVPG
jgi:transposase InsO family protein